MSIERVSLPTAMQERRGSPYKGYLLGLLMVILAFNFVDRIALGVVLEDIKADLKLSDTQLGFMGGIAFAFFYAVMGLPIARWADRGNRITIISLTTALWSMGVALCGVATNFVQLMLIRVGVAVGEAGCVPPAHSLIADLFTRTERPRAMAIYMLGAPLALTIGYFAAGWLNELYGWRATFVILGLPGLALAALTAVTLREPRREKSVTTRAVAQSPVQPRLKEVYATLWAQPSFKHMLLCFSVWGFFSYGILQWQPAFFMRSHGLASGEIGTWFALVYGVGGALGVYLGGEWAARSAANNERLQLVMCAAAFVFCALLMTAAHLVTDRYLAFGLLAVAAVGGNTSQGPIVATIQTLVQPRMRAMSIALLYLFQNLIGMGLGPWAAGALSDALRPHFGEESLRYALAILCPGSCWAAWHLWRASRTVERDLASAAIH